MGFTQHRTIVVSAHDIQRAVQAHREALRIFEKVIVDSAYGSHVGCVGPIIPFVVNGGASFMVATSGSKFDWGDEMAHTKACFTFADWLDSQRFSDGSSPFAWFEAVYGETAQEPERPRISRRPLRTRNREAK
jgi:hypothetical protein